VSNADAKVRAFWSKFCDIEGEKSATSNEINSCVYLVLILGILSTINLFTHINDYKFVLCSIKYTH